MIMSNVQKKGKVSVRSSLAARLKVRKTVKTAKPTFRRQEGYRHAKLKDSWRKPKGRHSKLRLREKARGKVVAIGFGSPSDVRGLNRQGYREVIVSSMADMEAIKPKEEMAVISSSVGKKKRTELVNLATKKKIHVANA